MNREKWPPVYVVLAAVILGMCLTVLVLGAMLTISTLAICTTILVIALKGKERK